MAVALLQFDTETLNIVGVWLSVTDSYYPDGTDNSVITAGRSAMARKFEDLSWEEWADYLSGERPVLAWWEQCEYGPADNKISIFHRYVR